MSADCGLRIADWRFRQHGRVAALLSALAVLLACATAGQPSPENPQSAIPNPQSVKRIAAVVMGEPPTLSTKINTASGGGVVPGADALEELVTAGLVRLDDAGSLHPQLAEAVPTIENGRWTVLWN